MYNECNSLISRHKITLDRLTCYENQSIHLKKCGIAMFQRKLSRDKDEEVIMYSH